MRKPVYIVIGLVAVVGLASLLPHGFAQSSVHDRYLCTLCGLRRTDDIRKLGPVTYRRLVTFEQSAVSRAFQPKECRHSWLLYHWDHSFRRLLVAGSGQGACQSFAVPALLEDDAFARDLARMQSPGKAWSSLVAALNSNRSFDEDLLEWRRNPENGSFSSWAVTNGYWVPPTNEYHGEPDH